VGYGRSLLYLAGIVRLCPTSGTRTQFNEDFGEGSNLRPILQNVYKEKP